MKVGGFFFQQEFCMNSKTDVPNLQQKLEDIATAGIERGADWEENATPDEIYSDAFDLAFDNLVDNHVDTEVARRIAGEVAQRYSQP